VLIISGFSWLRMAQAVVQWNFLETILPITPLYLAASGVIWGAAGLLLAWGSWQGKAWASLWVRLASLAYALYDFVDRLLLANPSVSRVNSVFSAGLTLLSLAIIFWILTRRKAKTFFGVMHDPKPQNSTTA
jgi:hypothetical protein